MARADLLCDLIKYGLTNDSLNFKKAAEALCAEERSKKHTILANKIEDLLKTNNLHVVNENSRKMEFTKNVNLESNLCWEKVPQKRLDQMILPDHVKKACNDLVEEQLRAEVLQSYGLEPRNKMLLIGPPGNGKTTLAEAVAESLMLPLLVVKYESIVGAYLGETASKLSKLFDYAKSRRCVLFFDEFETLGKERGDIHETGEIKRVVSSLLMQIDALPSYVIVIAATNHENLLDKAAWRRFQVKINIPKPTRSKLESFFYLFQKQRNFEFGLQVSTLAKKTLGLSYAEAEELALEIYRQYILNLPNENAKDITNQVLKLWQTQHLFNSELTGEEEKLCQKDQ
ncbi:AAA family ATPase [Anaerosacchariphilus polymeriproducens]|uniref:ATP-binding protein n=1 Tax=Anaerosacchariphilus polymeriproducens TaxID=1812858 RepID=A0A371AQW0_9FIRM|nr:ATP-binding protein [Anaerosacchariphilus polymeriproducens]RDU21912.1 ATP-binding protein [Anaerosacchariphilus polymeriproducens]